MLRSNTVPSFGFFPRLHGLRLWGGTASTGEANTPGGGGGGGSKQATGDLAISALSPTRPSPAADLSLTVNGSHLDLVHSGSHQTHTFAV